MAITAKTNRNMMIGTQQRVRWVIGSMSATEASVNVSCNDFKVVTGAVASFLGAPTAAMGGISVNEAPSTDLSHLVLNTANIIRVARVVHDSAAIKFCLVIYGW